MLQLINPSQIRSVAAGSGIEGRPGVLYQTIDESPSRLFWWDGQKHVSLPSALAMSAWYVHVGVWAARPSAVASGAGAKMVITDVGIGGYSEWRSDGTYWRPANGCVVLASLLTADVDMVAGNTTEQTLFTYSMPAGLMSVPFSSLRCFAGADKSGGTSDTLTLRIKIGGQTIWQQTAATTNINLGMSNMARRLSATTLRKSGRGGVTDTAAFGGSASTARPAAITVADMDANATAVLVTGQMTTGGAEYGSLHQFMLEYMA